ncbi:hypothetical protein BGX38DRAFT_281196 [Terfezia claveryi]|nr:hypothetical protein BGX38DRAFT_281196 [Terfezia claveryi]
MSGAGVIYCVSVSLFHPLGFAPLSILGCAGLLPHAHLNMYLYPCLAVFIVLWLMRLGTKQNFCAQTFRDYIYSLITALACGMYHLAMNFLECRVRLQLPSYIHTIREFYRRVIRYKIPGIILRFPPQKML